MSMLGQSDFVLRSLSAIISSLSVALLMVFAGSFWGQEQPFWAGLLNAVSPFDIHYAQEARMYRPRDFERSPFLLQPAPYPEI